MIRSALFIDFDNIFGGLGADYGDQVARSFATNPRRWIDWIESRSDRRILLQRCYLNPTPFGRYRLDLTHAACEVIDCPSLTKRGKSSADIYMALDIVDTLAQHRPRFDEFIIMSADADFTPVLFRLRRNDRRTLVIAPSMASAAYTRIADEVVDMDEFVGEALRPEGGALTRTVQVHASPCADPATVGKHREDALRSIKKQLRDAGEPLKATKVAKELKREFPGAGSEDTGSWFGYPRLSHFLSNHLSEVSLSQRIVGTSHLIYDPATHALPAQDQVAPSQIDPEEQPELHELSQRLARFAVPPLRREAWAALFRVIGTVAREGCDENLNGFSREVRNRVGAEGFPVSRQAVSRVAYHLKVADCDFRDPDGEWEPSELAAKYRSNLRSLAEDSGLELDEDQLQLLDEWLDGGQHASSASGAG